MLSFLSLLGRAGSLGCHLGVNWWSGKGLSLGAPRRLDDRKRTRRTLRTTAAKKSAGNRKRDVKGKSEGEKERKGSIVGAFLTGSLPPMSRLP